MQTARLGRTDLVVSAASLGGGGASRLGQANGLSVDESVRLVRLALEAGVNCLDTAAGYGTEAIVGQAIQGRREGVVISTKHAVTTHPRHPASGLVSAAAFCEMVDASLKTMQIDCVDVLYVHGLRPEHYDYCVAEILPAMEQLRQRGKLRFTGVSEAWRTDPTHAMLGRAVRDGWFDVIMVGLNVVNHSALAGILPMAKERDLGVQCMYAVRGNLGQRDLARPVIEEAIAAGEVDAAAVDQADPLGFLLEPGVSASLAEACYRFARHAPGIDTVLTGTGRIDHLTENLRAINGRPLPPEVLDRIHGAFGRVRSVTGD